jgi:hypothetical protein
LSFGQKAGHAERRLCVVDQILFSKGHYYSIFYEGGQNRLTEAGKPTALEQRLWLIMTFTEAVAMSATINPIKKQKKKKNP